MKVMALSDLHGYLPEDLPACDLLLLAGDLTPVTNHQLAFQAAWLDREFRAWLNRVPARHTVGVAGNHDFVFEKAPHLLPAGLRWTYLQDSGTEWEGWKIWGTPWQPWFFDWAFNADAERLKRQWSLIPDDIDILVLHGPPYGYGDGVPEDAGVRRCGCPHLLARVQQIRPRLVVYGHIHEGRGDWQLGPTRLANVTLLDENYRVRHRPWVTELERGEENSRGS